MTRIIIFDLDGTIYNSANRQHLAQAGAWDEFHEASVDDPVNDDVAWLARTLGKLPDVVLLGLTGRNERYRKITEGYLVYHDIPLDDVLMRPDDNYQKDIEMKMSILDAWLGEGGYTRDQILFALDDRDTVVDGMRAQGIKCWQVRESGY